MKKRRAKAKRPRPLAVDWSETELRGHERRLQRLLSLESLLQLNQRVEELHTGRFPAGNEMDFALAPEALPQILRLLLEAQLRRRADRRGVSAKALGMQLRTLQSELRRRHLLLAKLAGVLSQTYGELGEGAPLADDEALALLHELFSLDDEQWFDRERARGTASVRAWRAANARRLI
jgi:hypothetical protein